jgi:hypothetical protein
VDNPVGAGLLAMALYLINRVALIASKPAPTTIVDNSGIFDFLWAFPAIDILLARTADG